MSTPSGPTARSVKHLKPGDRVVVIGAGPAGLTAAYVLAKRTNARITVVEGDQEVGGISRTVRYKQFRGTIKGISSKTLASRLKELEKLGILQRQAYNEIPPRVEYRLTAKGQELVESVLNLLEWMRKWSGA